MNSSIAEQTLEIVLTALEQGVATIEQLRAATETQRKRRPPIGKLALTRRRLTTSQVFRILEQQATSEKLFGEIAVENGFLAKREIVELLELQSSRTPSLIDVLLESDDISNADVECLLTSMRQRNGSESKPPSTSLTASAT